MTAPARWASRCMPGTLHPGLVARLQHELQDLKAKHTAALEAHSARMDRHRDELSRVSLSAKLSAEERINSRLNALEAYQQQQERASTSMAHQAPRDSRPPASEDGSFDWALAPSAEALEHLRKEHERVEQLVVELTARVDEVAADSNAFRGESERV